MWHKYGELSAPERRFQALNVFTRAAAGPLPSAFGELEPFMFTMIPSEKPLQSGSLSQGRAKSQDCL